MADEGSVFQLDAYSGLYFHASSGFYHDPNAGWYYNTCDGVYYKFEDGAYVAIGSTVGTEECIPEIFESGTADPPHPADSVAEYIVIKPSGQDSGCTEPLATNTSCIESSGQYTGNFEPFAQGVELAYKSSASRNTASEKEPESWIGRDSAVLDGQYPLWYYDNVRAMYWYYSKEHKAYFMYNEGHRSPTAIEESFEKNMVECPSTGAKDVLCFAVTSGTSNGNLSSSFENGSETSCLPDGSVGLFAEDASQCKAPNHNLESMLEKLDSKDLLPSGQPEIKPEGQFPLWYFDKVRSVYWYYNDEYKAYFIYSQGNISESLEGGSTNTDSANLDRVQHSNTESQFLIVGGEENLEAHQDTVPTLEGCPFQPTSAWLEETLIEQYLRGYPHESCHPDEGPWITSADIFNETGLLVEESCHQEVFLPNVVQFKQDNLSLPQSDCEASDDGSENERSEELEEGEWVPDEPLKIAEFCSYSKVNDISLVREAIWQDQTWCDSKVSSPLDNDRNQFSQGTSTAQHLVSEVESDGPNNKGEGVKHNSIEEENSSLDDKPAWDPEQWQACYGQVVANTATESLLPRSIDLWDWIILEKEGKSYKRANRLVGRIASSANLVHPSLSGLIRTTKICATELNFVMVSSGRIYRLCRPGWRYLMSVEKYDSSNPTENWGFPSIGMINFEMLEESVKPTEPSDSVKSVLDSTASKSTAHNYWRYQGCSPKRKSKYRDLAAARRTLHGGFGIGPGQKTLPAHEQDRLDADEAADMPGALRKAAVAPPLGSDNVGKRMLQAMGWQEGQSLGCKSEGLIAPITACGNEGRKGLGWS